MALGAGALLLAILAGVAFGEARGWPWLAGPLQAALSQRLDRPVSLQAEGSNSLRLHLLGGIRLQVGRLHIGNAPGMAGDSLLDARDLQLTMHWADALRWRPGDQAVLQTLEARQVDLNLQRLADGRANWALGAAAANPATPAPRLDTLLRVGRVTLAGGNFQVNDAVQQLAIAGSLASTSPAPGGQAGLMAQASGSQRGRALKASLTAGAPQSWLSTDTTAPAVPVTLALQIGRVTLDFTGSVAHPLAQPDVRGDYRIAGPSLAAVGLALGVSLPKTRRFAMQGRLVQAGHRWWTVVTQASIGGSRLAGEFQFDNPPGSVPMLAGRLRGPTLLLQDLGPAVGASTEDSAKPVRAAGRVLPDAQFNLPALRAMNANVLVALDRLDFGTAQLQSASPLRAHLVLQDGQLHINAIDAGLAQGRVTGSVLLDGRGDSARWTLDLGMQGVQLQQWLRAAKQPGQPVYASGRLAGRITLAGRGMSTAALLASADGRVQLHWTEGALSHLLVEAAGLDIAQGLGVLLKGDRPLPVQCGVADLQVRAGVLTPKLLLVDTADSLLWVDGTLSLADERLALQAHVQPKDWSPLTLRAPLLITGTLGQPQLALDKAALAKRLLPAAALALLNPLLALLPLIDPGDGSAPAKGCAAVGPRYRAAMRSTGTP